MAPHDVHASLFGLLVFLCLGAQAGEYCYTYRRGGTTTYCEYGCCGEVFDNYCCDFELGVGVIIGIVFGCICFISIIVALVCCCIKSKGKAGRVVQPNAQPGVSVVYPGGQPGPAYGMQPMGGQPAGPYSKPPEYPPAYPPVYPPPPPAYYNGPANPAGTNPGVSNGFGQPATTTAAPQ